MKNNGILEKLYVSHLGKNVPSINENIEVIGYSSRVLSLTGHVFTGSIHYLLTLLLEKYLRGVRMFCVALRISPNAFVHSNAVTNYAMVIHLFRSAA